MQGRLKKILEKYDFLIGDNDYQVHHSCSDDITLEIKTLLESKVTLNLEEKSPRGRAPLHLAVLNHDYALISSLAEAKADLNVKDQQGRTPLHLAVTNRLDDSYEGQMTQKLIDFKADPNVVDNSLKTPLHVAIEHHCHSWRIYRLLMAKANVVIKDNRGKTSIDLAYDEGYQTRELYGPFYRKNLIEILKEYILTQQKLEALTQASHPRLGAESPAKILFNPPIGDRNVLRVIGLFLGGKEKINSQPDQILSEDQTTALAKNCF